MHGASDVVTFLHEYERRVSDDDVTRVAELYAESFLFSGPQSASAVRRDDFVKVLPKRRAVFRSIGLTRMSLDGTSEMTVDERHVLARVEWRAEIEREGTRTSIGGLAATYLLRRHEQSFQIVAQVDHDDLMTRL